MQYKLYRAKELRAELLETYYTNKYPDKYRELDFDKMNPKEQEICRQLEWIYKKAGKWPKETNGPVNMFPYE